MSESDNGFCPKCGHPVYRGIKHDCAAWSATHAYGSATPWRTTPPEGRKFAQCILVPTEEYIVLQWDPALRRWCDCNARYLADDVLWVPLRKPPPPMSQWGGITDKTHELEP